MYLNQNKLETNVDNELTKNKRHKIKIIILVVIVIIILISTLFLLLHKKTEYFLKLKGNSDIVLTINSSFIDPGYEAYDSKGKTYNENDVIITGEVNTKIVGEYVITYKFNEIEQKRHITIVNESSNNTILGLIGDNIIFIPIGNNYEEPGYYAIDSIHTNEEMIERVTITGNINTNQAGTYKLIYSLITDDNVTITKERLIIVTSGEFVMSHEPTEPTNNDVKIYGYISDNYFDYILLPDGTITNNRNFSYIVNENKSYEFEVFLKDGSSHKETIEITNIDKEKPNGTCNVVLNNNTEITVNAKDNVGIYKYSYNISDKVFNSENNTYTIDGLNRDIKVTLYDKATNSETINCEVTDYSWPHTIKISNENIEKPKHYNQKQKFNNLNYIIYYPNDLDLNKKNPLVVFLHGGGECSNYISGMFNDNTAFVNNMKSGKFKGAVFLAPQCDCTREDGWKYCTENVKKLIDKIVKDYNINEKRISISCHSLGCTATYDLAEKYTDFFSAIALLAPSTRTGNTPKYKNFKTVVRTGTKDGLHGINKGMVEYLQNKGANMKFFEVKNADHNIQPYAFDKMNTIEWLINQERK